MPGPNQKKAVKVTSKKNVTTVSNAVKLDANNPIPFEVGGSSFSIVQNTRYLRFLDPKDNFAQVLLETRLLSDTHNSCVTTKARFCAGNGFQDKSGEELTKEIQDWFKSMNRKNQSIGKLNKRIFGSHFTWGNTPIELVRLTVGKKKYFFVYVHNFLEWRLCPPDEDGVVSFAYHSKLFRRNGAIITAKDLQDSKKLPIYSPLNTDRKNWLKDDNGTERTLLWFSNPIEGYDNYGMPSAVASMIFQLLEYKGARFDLDNFDNNMIVSAILALQGNMSQAETDKIAKKILSTHTGDGKRGRVAVISSEEKIEGSSFMPMETQKEGSYIQADDKWTQKIILANEWDAILAGLVSPSTFGKGSGFITKILELKTRTVIKPAQQELFEDVWSHVFALAQEWLGLPFDQYDLEIKNEIDISGLTDVDITPAVKVNEVRKAKGLPEDPGMDGVYMKSTGPQTVPTNTGGSDVSN